MCHKAKIEQKLSIRDFKWMTVITKVLRKLSRKQSLGSLNQILKPELLFLLFSEAVTFTITIVLPCPFSISLQKLLLVSIKERSLTTAPPLSYSRTTLVVAGQRHGRSPNKRSSVNELLGIGGVSMNPLKLQISTVQTPYITSQVMNLPHFQPCYYAFNKRYSLKNLVPQMLIST